MKTFKTFFEDFNIPKGATDVVQSDKNVAFSGPQPAAYGGGTLYYPGTSTQIDIVKKKKKLRSNITSKPRRHNKKIA